MKSYETDGFCCPGCNKINDAVMEMPDQEEGGPEVGAVSICITCGYPGIFDLDGAKKLYVRETTDEEKEELYANEQFIHYMAALMETKLNGTSKG